MLSMIVRISRVIKNDRGGRRIDKSDYCSVHLGGTSLPGNSNVLRLNRGHQQQHSSDMYGLAADNSPSLD